MDQLYVINRTNPCKGFYEGTNDCIFVTQNLYAIPDPLEHILDRMTIPYGADRSDNTVSFYCEVSQTDSYVEVNTDPSIITDHTAPYKYHCEDRSTDIEDSYHNCTFHPDFVLQLEKSVGPFYHTDQLIIYPDITRREIDCVCLLFKHNQSWLLLSDIWSMESKAVGLLLDLAQSELDKYYLNKEIKPIIYVCRDWETKYFVIKTDFYDRVDGYRYISFIENEKWLTISEFRNWIQGHRKPLSAFRTYRLGQLNQIKSIESNCTDNLVVQIALRPGWSGPKPWDKRGDGPGAQSVANPHSPPLSGPTQTGGHRYTFRSPQSLSVRQIMADLFDSYTVLNYYHKPSDVNNEKGYCLNSILIGGKSKGQWAYWEILLKSNYYQMETSRSQSELIELIRSVSPVVQLDLGTFSVRSYVAQTTWRGSCLIRQLPQNKIPFRIGLTEAPDDYVRYQRKLIDQSYPIDNLIVLTACLLRSTDPILRQRALSHPSVLINQTFKTPKYLGDHFYLSPKRDVGAGQTSGIYRLWYWPHVQIVNMDLFNQALDSIGPQMSYGQLRTDPQLSNLLRQSTNFYDLYVSSDFVHTSRDLTDSHIAEIDGLLNKFQLYLYGNVKEPFETFDMRSFMNRISSVSFDQYIRHNPIVTWSHYPNAPYYNVFHLHVVHFHSESKLDEAVLTDRIRRYMIKDDRPIFYKYLRMVRLADCTLQIYPATLTYELGQSSAEVKARWAEFMERTGRVDLYMREKERIDGLIDRLVQKYLLK